MLFRSGKEINRINTEHNAALIVEQGKLIESQGKIVSLERQRSDDVEWIRKMKLKAMAVCGLLALACTAGGIFSPIFKDKFIIAAAAFGVAAAAIMYVQPWMICVAIGAIILALIIKMTLDHHVMDKTATNAVSYIQANKPTDTSALKDFMGKYSSDSQGNTIVVPDPAVEKVITNILKSTNQL